jgi:type VI secretion system protein VasD
MPAKPSESSRRDAKPSLSALSARVLGLGTTLGLCAALSLGACKGKKETCNPDDYVFEDIALLVQATEDLNLDEEGNPLPTVIRVYQMSGDLATRSLDFTELWEDAEAALGDEYISEKEFQIYPDSKELIQLTVEKDARYLLAFAVFQQPVGNTWYRVYKIPDSYGRQACDMKKEDKDPATLGQPCVYLSMERNQIDGGKNPPPGFDKGQVEEAELTCTPIYTKKTVSSDDEGGKKKKKKK